MMNIQRQLVLALIAYSERRDVPSSLACLHSGVNVDTIQNDVGARLTVHQTESLWKNLVHISEDPLYGLRFGESMQLAALGVVGQIIQTSNNVADALKVAAQLAGLVCDMFSMELIYRRQSVLIRLVADPLKKEASPVTFRQMSDYLMAFVVRELDGLLLQRLSPLSARFAYPLDDPREYERVMRCKVNGGAMETSVEIGRECLERTVISANYAIQNHLLEMVAQMRRDHSAQEKCFRSRVYHYLLSNSYLFDVSIGAVASNFNMSTRTFQRRLQEEASSFHEIADSVRRDLALGYLGAGGYQVKDIASLLGYKEESALIRAFRRWTGGTPGEFMKGAKRSYG